MKKKAFPKEIVLIGMKKNDRMCSIVMKINDSVFSGSAFDRITDI